VFKDLPNIALHENDVAFAYDNLGRLRVASDAYSTHRFDYDALGRLWRTGMLGDTWFEYDLAGRRSRMTWPDGVAIGYDYYGSGEVKAIVEKGQGGAPDSSPERGDHLVRLSAR
jgi:YD repeat-containing protein